GTFTQEGETGTSIRVSRDEFQVDPRDVPEETKPDEDPQIPTQENELHNGDTDKHVPETGGGKMPASAGSRIPSPSVDWDPKVPEQKAKSVDQNQEANFGWNGIAQVDC